MNLILDGKYGDWSLPKGCTIAIANNPDNGRYNVQSFDEAGLDRMFTYTLRGDVDSWVQWATESNIPEACINFLYKSEEARDKDGAPSYRKWSNFFYSIANFNLKDKNDLMHVYRMGVGSIGEGYTKMFQTFIDNNLDIIPSLKWVFDSKNDEREVLDVLNKSIYSVNSNGDKVMRNDIKGLLGLRIKSYFRNPKVDQNEVDRFSVIIDANIIQKDSLMYILTDMVKADHPHKNTLLSKMISNGKIKAILTETTDII